jgi:hypothetical protein
VSASRTRDDGGHHVAVRRREPAEVLDLGQFAKEPVEAQVRGDDHFHPVIDGDDILHRLAGALPERVALPGVVDAAVVEPRKGVCELERVVDHVLEMSQLVPGLEDDGERHGIGQRLTLGIAQRQEQAVLDERVGHVVLGQPFPDPSLVGESEEAGCVCPLERTLERLLRFVDPRDIPPLPRLVRVTVCIPVR